MSQPKSNEAFPDCREFLDRALASEKGWRATFAERGQATNFRLRCYATRRRDMIFNAKLYAKDEAMHNRTVWDGIVLLVRQTDLGWAVLGLKGDALQTITLEQGPIE